MSHPLWNEMVGELRSLIQSEEGVPTDHLIMCLRRFRATDVARFQEEIRDGLLRNYRYRESFFIKSDGGFARFFDRAELMGDIMEVIFIFSPPASMLLESRINPTCFLSPWMNLVVDMRLRMNSPGFFDDEEDYLNAMASSPWMRSLRSFSFEEGWSGSCRELLKKAPWSEGLTRLQIPDVGFADFEGLPNLEFVLFHIEPPEEIRAALEERGIQVDFVAERS